MTSIIMNNVPWYFTLLILTTVQLFVGTAGENDPLVDSIFLRLYGKSLSEYDDQLVSSAELLIPKMDLNKPTTIYIPGYSETVESESVAAIVNAYLVRGGHNILALDYRTVTRSLYTTAVRVLPDVGITVAAGLNKMFEAGVNLETLHIIGHSLGSQTAAQIAKEANFLIPRITGLDPAGPLFYHVRSPLSSKSARFVDIIHTDAGVYGNARITGTVDFFPNGGHRVQPGCPAIYLTLSNQDFCSHHRSWKFYAESVMDDGAFVAVKCSSRPLFLSGACNNNEKVLMGYATPVYAKGTFHLSTGKIGPFGLREAGAEKGLKPIIKKY